MLTVQVINATADGVASLACSRCGERVEADWSSLYGRWKIALFLHRHDHAEAATPGARHA